MMSSARSAPRLHNKDLRKLREITEGVGTWQSKTIQRRNGKKGNRLCKDFVCPAVTVRLV
jgi:hypothetical protein